jgi:hypothetical protein
MARMSQRGFRHREAYRKGIAERGRGLRPDELYLAALAADDDALEWLRRHEPSQYRRVEALLRERSGGGLTASS